MSLAALPLRPPLPPARALPWAMVLAGSATTALPLITTVPLLPPLGLLILLTWRLLAPLSLRRWAAAPLGLFDDLVSGQPLGSAVLLWSLCFLVIDLIERRSFTRAFAQDWLIAAIAIAATLFAGRLLAVPLALPVDGPIAAQAATTALLFPASARLIAWVDRRRSAAA